ncbi:hypothetical protein CW304_30570 [Bacillus sp. UFRGS-B20]|nr:hypothetical protein CW304_30570 [Bacillus sp. UFRGS-B20]
MFHEVLVTHKTRIDEVLLTALGQASSIVAISKPFPIHLEGHGREEMIEGIDLSIGQWAGVQRYLSPFNLNFQELRHLLKG